jgi:lambda family phage portal protein
VARQSGWGWQLTNAAPNLIDRAISYVAPRFAMRRLAARQMMAVYGSYVGARADRRETAGWQPRAGNADADSLLDLRILRARSRDLQRNAPLASGAVSTVVENAVGTGLVLQPTPDVNVLGWTDDQAAEWVKTVESEFGLWADSKDCDITRTQNFYEQQGLVFRSALESGDVLTLLPFYNRDLQLSPYQLRLQVIEADRLANPNNCRDGQKLDNGNRVYGGVEVDEVGCPVAYNILRRHPGAMDLTQDPWAFDRIEAFSAKTGKRNIIHLFDRKRPDQKRGIPYLAPVIERLKQLDRYTEAEIQAAVISAMFTVFIKTGLGEDGTGLQQSQTPAEIANIEKSYKLGTGAIVGLAEGQDVTMADPKRPNVAFDGFVLAMLRQIGVALELPFEILVKHFTASYSAARAALLEAWKFYRNRRYFVAENWCQPAYEAFMFEAVALGRINAPGFFTDPLMRRAYLLANWVGDAPGQIDPEKEAAAAGLRIAEGLSNLKIETMELTGKNWEDVHKQRVKEHQMRVEGGLEAAVPGVQPIAKTVVPTTDGGDEETPDNTQPGTPEKKQ